jgi:hypothetical protein
LPVPGDSPRRSAACAALVIMSASSRMMSLKPLLYRAAAVERPGLSVPPRDRLDPWWRRQTHLKRTRISANVLIWSRTTSMPRSSLAFSCAGVGGGPIQLQDDASKVCVSGRTHLKHMLLKVLAIDSPGDGEDRTRLAGAGRPVEEQVRQPLRLDELLDYSEGAKEDASAVELSCSSRPSQAPTCSGDSLVRDDVVERHWPVLLDPEPGASEGQAVSTIELVGSAPAARLRLHDRPKSSARDAPRQVVVEDRRWLVGIGRFALALGERGRDLVDVDLTAGRGARARAVGSWSARPLLRASHWESGAECFTHRFRGRLGRRVKDSLHERELVVLGGERLVGRRRGAHRHVLKT